MAEVIRVLVVDPGRDVADVVSGFPGVTVQWESDSGKAMECLANREHEVGLVACELGDDRTGHDFVREAVDAGCVLPLVLTSPEKGEAACDAALRAGASTFVDLSAGHALEWAIRFAHAASVNAEARNERLLHGLASFLAHEGKNALAGIGGAVQVISDRLPSGSAEQLISQEIRDRLDAFNATLETLTYVLRPSTDLLRVPVAVRSLIESAAAQIPGATVEISGEDMQILGDRAQLHRLFRALLENAAEAGDGPIQVSIDRAGEDCVVEVNRKGPCLRPADLTRLLEPFYTTKPGRPGLGLPVAKRIAEAHRGTIRLRCTGDRGLFVTTRVPATPPTA